MKDRDCSVATEQYREDLTGETGVEECSDALAERNDVESFSVGDITASGDAGKAAVTTDGDEVTLITGQGGRGLAHRRRRRLG